MSDVRVSCCIAGGGPAGMMLGYLLSRAGLSVAVLEKHADFLRDFRGDTIHPSTLEVMDELGLLDDFLKLPHEKVSRFAAQFGNETLTIADLSHLKVKAPYVAFMPQWDFLDFLADRARATRKCTLLMQAKVTGLVESNGVVRGVKARTSKGPQTITADLVVGADGRHSTIREAAGLTPVSYGAPMDVLWFRVSRHSNDPSSTMGRFDRGRIFIQLNRGDYWQCAYVIAKGSEAAIKAAGIEAFRKELAAIAPAFANRTAELATMEDLKLLTVQVDRLETWWKPGLLMIGDAAHAMSPVGGVGINLAIQDAVAAANLLCRPLKTGTIDVGDLAKVQSRRDWPAKMTQRMQITMQNAIIRPALAGKQTPRPPRLLRLLAGIPLFRRLPARLLGLGIRPEHVSEELRRPID
jgi:2-polyprenyl-6-methoxyphenol hydroxylase-like FAD-dependent oxidoreductase